MTVWIDLIIGLIVVECGALLLWRRYRGGGVPASALVPNLLAGAMLLLAMRFALGGGGLMVVGPFLFAGLLAHLADLRGRWS